MLRFKVTFEVNGQEVQIELPVLHVIRNLYEMRVYSNIMGNTDIASSEKVMAIRLIRSLYNLSLKDAKDYCDYFGLMPKWEWQEVVAKLEVVRRP